MLTTTIEVVELTQIHKALDVTVEVDGDTKQIAELEPYTPLENAFTATFTDGTKHVLAGDIQPNVN